MASSPRGLARFSLIACQIAQVRHRSETSDQPHTEEFRAYQGVTERGGARSPERTVLRMADFPDNREFTGKIVKIGLQAANSPYNNRIFLYG